MSGDGSLGYCSLETSHFSHCHFNDDGISDDEILGVSVGDIICRFRSQDTRHSSSRNSGVYHSGY